MSQKNPLRELRGGVWPVEAETDPRRRERIAGRVVALNRELAGQARRRRSLWWLSAAALIGGLCTLLVLLHAGRTEPTAMGVGSSAVRLIFGAASVSRGGVLAPVGDGPIDVTAEPVLVTRADQAAEFRLTSDAALRLDAASEVGLERRQNALGFEEHVHLKAGSIALRVPKLGARSKLAVETRDSSIEVHGTQFSVRWVEHAAQSPFTEVHVEQGKVLVRGRDGASRMLSTGDDWRSNATAAEKTAAVDTAAEDTAAQKTAPQEVAGQKASAPDA
ncbi:MAG TPA: FecR family protein, partial [Polyangiaceae bacterium]|nr:FecR family protein [Polyangiaceae bacterium]